MLHQNSLKTITDLSSGNKLQQANQSFWNVKVYAQELQLNDDSLNILPSQITGIVKSTV